MKIFTNNLVFPLFTIIYIPIIWIIITIGKKWFSLTSTKKYISHENVNQNLKEKYYYDDDNGPIWF